MASNQSCCVMGCDRKGNGNAENFHAFPKNRVLRGVWKTFTRREGLDAESQVICSEHFHPTCFIYKKKHGPKPKLDINAVPTIFKRGEETTVVTFDPLLMKYVEEKSLLNPSYDQKTFKSICEKKRRKRLTEIKVLCRFCLSNDAESKHAPIKSFVEYLIKPEDVFARIGIDLNSHGIFSKICCEECFENIISFDGFRKRCRDAHAKTIRELKDFNIPGFEGSFDDEDFCDKEYLDCSSVALNYDTDCKPIFIKSEPKHLPGSGGESGQYDISFKSPSSCIDPNYSLGNLKIRKAESTKGLERLRRKSGSSGNKTRYVKKTSKTDMARKTKKQQKNPGDSSKEETAEIEEIITIEDQQPEELKLERITIWDKEELQEMKNLYEVSEPRDAKTVYQCFFCNLVSLERDFSYSMYFNNLSFRTIQAS